MKVERDSAMIDALAAARGLSSPVQYTPLAPRTVSRSSKKRKVEEVELAGGGGVSGGQELEVKREEDGCTIM
jgi:hypothetical protein